MNDKCLSNFILVSVSHSVVYDFCDPMDLSLPDASVHVLQAETLGAVCHFLLGLL